MQISIKRLRAMTGIAVVAAAAASGFFMQRSASAPQSWPAMDGAVALAVPGAASQATVLTQMENAGAAVAAPLVQSPAAPVLPRIPDEPMVTRAVSRPMPLLSATAPILPDAPSAPQSEVMLLAATQPASVPLPDMRESEPSIAPSATDQTCEMGFTSVAARGAMVELTLEAPCLAGQEVEFAHAGMRFSAHLDRNGMVELVVPALQENAVFDAILPDGQRVSTEILMLTMSDYQRTALTWRGQAGFGLYALEDNATYGSAGMVSAEQPYGPDRAISGEGGFLTMLGDSADGLHAVIYSWPVRLGDFGPPPEISIEAEVLAQNCDREIKASVMRVEPGKGIEKQPLSMVVPGCDAVGSYLVLKNLPQAVRIATN